MKQLRAYKFRMYTNDLQQELINKTIGCVMLIYNIILAKKKDNNSLIMFYLVSKIPSLIKEYLSEVDIVSLRCTITDFNKR